MVSHLVWDLKQVVGARANEKIKSLTCQDTSPLKRS